MKKPRPIKAIGSKRRAAGWMLAILGLLVAGVWAVSKWRWYEFRSGHVMGGVDQGGLWLQRWTGPAGVDFSVFEPAFENGDRWRWRTRLLSWPVHTVEIDLFVIAYSGSGNPFGANHGDEQFALVFWPLPLLLWTTGGLALWSGRRARRRALEGHCPTCGYNLAGLNADAGVCPECGKAKGTK